METQNKKNNRNQLILAIVIIAVIAVIAFAVSGKSNKPDTVSNQLPLTEDNLIASWEKEENEEEYRYYIVFEYGNGFIYARHTGDELSPSLVSTHGEFFIEGDMISVSFELDGETISEKYYVAVSADKVTLSPIENGGEFLVGTYIKEGLSEKDTSSTANNESSVSTKDSNTVNNNATNTTATTSTEPTEKTTEKQVSESEWKQAYRSYVEKAALEGYEAFNLIYIDDDNIPELYLCGNSEYIGEKVCTFKKGTVIALDLPRLYGTLYIERSGLIKNSNGSMGCYFDTIYKLEKGSFSEIHSGTNEMIENQVEYYYVYTMDGKDVSQSEYQQILDSSFNSNRGKAPDINAKDYSSFMLDLQ